MTRRQLRLFDLLPAHVRQRDTHHHTQRLLGSADELLDRLHATLQQYHRDNFPDHPEDDGPASQAWLLPYFAELLDARLVSPLEAGRRAEVMQAIRWRQRGGTLAAVDEIAEAVGQWEVVVQEGWQRLAMTPRLDTPLLPESCHGLAEPLPAEHPAVIARHPGLPAVTPDFRCASQAVADPGRSPLGQISRLHGQEFRWRQHSPHGIPCHHQRIDPQGRFHGAGFDDVSRRTPDLREPDWRVGHAHPRRLLLHVMQPEGFFQRHRVRVRWRQQWLDDLELPSERFLEHVAFYCRLDRTLVFANRHPERQRVEVQGVFMLGQVPETGVGPADPRRWRFEDLIVVNRLEADSGRLELERCALRQVRVHSIDMDEPVIEARDCLFDHLRSARSLTRLEYVTVLGSCLVEALDASDCIFRCPLRKDDTNALPPAPLCVRYSSILPDQVPDDLQRRHHNTRAPVVMFSETFGEPGCGVLHPACDSRVRYRAEDATEPGAYHFLQIARRLEAVVEKLQDSLAVGQRAAVIPDAALARLPDAIGKDRS